MDSELKSSVIGYRKYAWGHAAIFSLFLLLVTGCPKEIKVPPSDRTPPTVVLLVSGIGPAFTLTEGGNAEIRSLTSSDTTIVLVAIANDEDGGIKNVQIQGEVAVSCAGGSGLEQMNRASYISQNPDDAHVGESALNQRATSITLRVPELQEMCTGTWTFLSLRGTFVGLGGNFHGGNAETASLHFSYP